MNIADRKQIKQLAELLKRHSESVYALFALAHQLGTDPESLKKSITSLARYSEALEQELRQ